MKDLFSEHSDDYSIYRTSYPDALIDFILSKVKGYDIAWDCGTGNGQLAAKLSPHFNKIIATDLSQNQIENAIHKENIKYQVMKAEEASFDGIKFDLITVAQAIHWFDFDRFYKNVSHYLDSDGIFAIVGYELLYSNPQCDKLIDHLYTEVLGDYWQPERKYIQDGYKTIPFPFEETWYEEFEYKTIWSIDRVIGYLNTWSSTKAYIKKHQRNPVDFIKDELEQLWGNKQEITIPLFVRIGKNFDMDRL